MKCKTHWAFFMIAHKLLHGRHRGCARLRGTITPRDMFTISHNRCRFQEYVIYLVDERTKENVKNLIKLKKKL